MKKILIICPLLVAFLLISGCKKSDIDDAYYNPEKAITATIPTLYAGLFFNDYVVPRYWDLYTFKIPMIGTYSQTTGYSQGKSMYEQATNYTQNRWNSHYAKLIAQYREIEKYYNSLSGDQDKAGFQIFMETSRIFTYDQTAQIADLWGDVPFSTAGQLNATGTITLATYDNAEDLYAFMITDLLRISDYMASTTIDAFYLSQLKTYDYINNGNVLLWRKYCNSLALRLAMRISYQNETSAKATIQKILSNPTQYPLIDNVSENVRIQANGTTSKFVALNDMRGGFGVNPYAPGVMVNDVMVPSNDPRLAIFFTTNSKGEYVGVPNTWSANRVSDSINVNYFSRYDSTTFTEDNLFPGILFTASETSFIKAEAYERWGGGTAQTEYENGIKQSIQFYIAINNNSDYKGGKNESMPSDADMATFLGTSLIAYGNGTPSNLEKIGTQKWIDFNVMQAPHAWAEWRRTKYPTLSFPTDASSVKSPNVPTRLIYPSDESALNTVNYQSVKAKDNVTTKIFWDVK